MKTTRKRKRLRIEREDAAEYVLIMGIALELSLPIVMFLMHLMHL